MVAPYLVDKPLGATPLEALAMARAARPEIAEAKLSYAGRLDPMATGLVLVLHGPLLSHQEDYWQLSKVYEASVVLGMTTDSYDLLGMPTPVIPVSGTWPSHDRILTAVARLVGKHRLAVPAFSSHRVEGKPLFVWAREGRTDLTPVRTMAVMEVAVHDIGVLPIDQLHERIRERVPQVRGDFRQAAIVDAWDEVLHDRRTEELPVIRLTVHCSAGTYLRSLAHALGQMLGTGGMLLFLRRTRVGSWSIDAPEVIRTG